MEQASDMSETPHRYVCKVEDLDKFLDEKLTKEFQSLFYNFPENGERQPDPIAWRMFWGKTQDDE